MTYEELKQLVYYEVKADIETEDGATDAYQEGYSVGFNDCRYRVLKALAARLSLSPVRAVVLTEDGENHGGRI